MSVPVTLLLTRGTSSQEACMCLQGLKVCTSPNAALRALLRETPHDMQCEEFRTNGARLGMPARLFLLRCLRALPVGAGAARVLGIASSLLLQWLLSSSVLSLYATR
jgi:hypothetical protein